MSWKVTIAWWQTTKSVPIFEDLEWLSSHNGSRILSSLALQGCKKILPQEQPNSSLQQQTKCCHFGEFCFEAYTTADGMPEGRQISLNCLCFPTTPYISAEEKFNLLPPSPFQLYLCSLDTRKAVRCHHRVSCKNGCIRTIFLWQVHFNSVVHFTKLNNGKRKV